MNESGRVDEFSPEQKAALTAEVKQRFGILPKFFESVADAPAPVRELWSFTRSAYLDNPMPSVFKERVFVHLSRFCSARYCIVRHVGFLLGLGNPAGDAGATPQTVADVVRLLARPAAPSADELQLRLSRLASYPLALPLPAPDTEAEDDILAACGAVFLHPARSIDARRALTAAVGPITLELLTALIAFIRTTHYWNETHPEVPFEADLENLLRSHEELARLLLDQNEGVRSELGQRLFDELELLRSERDDRIALRQALADREESQRRQTILIDELNHRVKNTLAIIQSIARQTLRGDDIAPQMRDAFMARLLALADAHDILTEESWDGADLEAVVAKTFPKADPHVAITGPLVRLVPKIAVTLSMALHELATNARRHGSLSNSTGRISIEWRIDADDGGGNRLLLVWKETGGPHVRAPERRGFGSRLIERGLAGELGGEATLVFEADGLRCIISAPMPMVGVPS